MWLQKWTLTRKCPPLEHQTLSITAKGKGRGGVRGGEGDAAEHTELIGMEPWLPLHIPPYSASPPVYPDCNLSWGEEWTLGTEGMVRYWEEKEFWWWIVRISDSTPLYSQNISPAPLSSLDRYTENSSLKKLSSCTQSRPIYNYNRILFKIPLLKTSSL